MAKISYIERVNDKSIRAVCACGTSYNNPIKAGYEPRFLEEFQEYENFHTDPCPTCGAINVFNMNLPETGLEPEELEQEPFFPDIEKEFRENTRALMWKLRPDLKGKDRASVAALRRKQTEESRGLTIEQIRQESKRVARLMGVSF